MIRKLVIVTLAVLALALAATAQTSASAPAPTKIGIINIQQAIAQTNEGQRDYQTLEKKFEPKRNELQSSQTELENLKKQLSTQGDKLNDAARADLERNIANKTKSMQRNYEDAETDYRGQANEIINRIGQKMVEIINKYTMDNGYAVVLDVSAETSPVVSANPNTNITQPIIEAYNAQSNVPAPAAGSAPKTGKSGLPGGTPAPAPKK
jgi:outer membrane protein